MEMNIPKPLNQLQVMVFASYGPLLMEELSEELAAGKTFDELTPELQYTFKSIEMVEGESMTVPDESMSIREILERAARGILPVGPNGDPYYEEDEDHWSDDNMDRRLYVTGLDDLTDLDSIKAAKEYLNGKLSELESRLKSASPVIMKDVKEEEPTE